MAGRAAARMSVAGADVSSGAVEVGRSSVAGVAEAVKGPAGGGAAGDAAGHGPLEVDRANVRTAMINSRTVPAPLPAHTGVSPTNPILHATLPTL